MNVDISCIEPHPFNEKVYQLSNLEALKEDIAQVGQLEPLTCIKKWGEPNKFVCVSGHRRLAVLQQLKIKEAKINVVKIKKADIPRFIISHNNTRVKSPQERKAEYKELNKVFSRQQGKKSGIGKKYDRLKEIASVMGMSRSSLGKFIFVMNHRPEYFKAYEKGIMNLSQAYRYASTEVKEEEARFDNKVTKEKKEPHENWTLYYKSSHLLEEIKDNSVDLICTSPPYYKARAYSNNKNEMGLEDSVEEYVTNLANHLDSCFRVLSNDGNFFLNLGDGYSNGSLQMVPQRVVLEMMKRHNYFLRNTIIFYKKNRKPSSKKSVMNPSYEFIFHLTKQKTGYIYKHFTRATKDARIDFTPRHRNLDGKYYMGKNKVNHFIPKPTSSMVDAWIEEDIIATAVGRHIKEVERIEHPAIYPVELFVKVIENCTRDNSIILDPFMGRGTTGMSMDIINQSDGGNRKFIGYDLKDYRY